MNRYPALDYDCVGVGRALDEGREKWSREGGRVARCIAQHGIAEQRSTSKMKSGWLVDS